MFNLIVFALITIAVVLSLVFRRSLIVRIGGVAFLCLLATLPATYLLAGHRLVMEKGYDHFKVPAGDLPQDFMLAVDYVQTMNHLDLSLYLAIIAALTVLAVFPIKHWPKSGGDQT